MLLPKIPRPDSKREIGLVSLTRPSISNTLPNIEMDLRIVSSLSRYLKNRTAKNPWIKIKITFPIIRMMTNKYKDLKKGVCMVEWWVGGNGFQKGWIVHMVLKQGQWSRGNLMQWIWLGWGVGIWYSTCRNSLRGRWRRSWCRLVSCRSGSYGTWWWVTRGTESLR